MNVCKVCGGETHDPDSVCADCEQLADMAARWVLAFRSTYAKWVEKQTDTSRDHAESVVRWLLG